MFESVAQEHEDLHQASFKNIWEKWRRAGDSAVSQKRWPCAALAKMGPDGVSSYLTQYGNRIYMNCLTKAVTEYGKIQDEEQNDANNAIYQALITQTIKSLLDRCVE